VIEQEKSSCAINKDTECEPNYVFFIVLILLLLAAAAGIAYYFIHKQQKEVDNIKEKVKDQEEKDKENDEFKKLAPATVGSNLELLMTPVSTESDNSDLLKLIEELRDEVKRLKKAGQTVDAVKKRTGRTTNTGGRSAFDQEAATM